MGKAAKMWCQVADHPAPKHITSVYKHVHKDIREKRVVGGWLFAAQRDGRAPLELADALTPDFVPESPQNTPTTGNATPADISLRLGFGSGFGTGFGSAAAMAAMGPAPPPARALADFEAASVGGAALTSAAGPGVYVLRIQNLDAEHVKIGSTRDFRERLQKHLADGMDVREWVSFHPTVLCNEVENEVKKRLRHHNTPITVAGRRRVEIFSGIRPLECVKVVQECVDEFDSRHDKAHEHKMLLSKIKLAELETRKAEIQLELAKLERRKGLCDAGDE